MPFSPIDPTDEQRVFQDIQFNVDKQKQYESLVNSDVATRVGQIYKQAPYIPAGVVLALAKAGSSQTAVDTVATIAAKQLVTKQPKKQGWFEKNVYGNLKELARWTTAALNLVPDLAQNVASQAFNPNNPKGLDGLFKSTQLGTMLANSGEAGDGFFMGEELAKTQAQRARDFRGVVDGTNSAWTIGRGSASVFFKPGSAAYSVLSGFVDAAVMLGADPTGPVGTKFRNVEAVSDALPYALKTREARAAINAIPGVSGDDLSLATKVLEGHRANAGLKMVDDIVFDQTKFGQWATTNNRAIRLTNLIVDIAADPNATQETKMFRIMEKFKRGNSYMIDPDTAAQFATADTPEEVRAVLGLAASRLDNNPNDVLLVSDIRKVRGAKWLTAQSERSPALRSILASKWLSDVPESSVVFNGTGQEKSRMVKTYADYLRGMGIEDVEAHPVMDKVMKAVTLESPADAKSALDEAFDEVVTGVLEQVGWDKRTARKSVAKLRSNLAESRVYTINRLGNADDGGLVQALFDSGILPESIKDMYLPDTWDKLVLKGPGAIVEMLDRVQVLPDYRRLRAAATAPWLGKTKVFRNSNGDVRKAFELAEMIQQDVWKPLTLATGGYIMRNMMDAQVRIGMHGYKGLFNHPLQFIMYAMGRKGAGDIMTQQLAAGFKQIDEFLADPPEDMKAFVEALQFGVYRNLEDSRVSLENMVKNDNFSLVARSNDARAHTTGYIDNLALTHNDPIDRQVAQFMHYTDPVERQKMILDWLNSAEGAQDKQTLRRYFDNGLRIGSADGSGTDELIQIDKAKLDDNQYLAHWVGKLAEARVQLVVNGDEDLRIIAAHNRIPFYTRTADGGAVIPADRVSLEAGQLAMQDMVYGSPDFVGSVVSGGVLNLPEGSDGLIVGKRLVRDENGKVVKSFNKPIEELIIAPVFEDVAMPKNLPQGRPELRDLLDMKGNMGKLTPIVKRAERGAPDQDQGAFKRLGDIWTSATDKFFKGLYGRATQTLEKSPLFRQIYYKTVVNNVELLSKEQAGFLVENIKAAAKGLEKPMSPENYVGDKKIWQALVDAVDTATGSGTVDQLDSFAKASALMDMQDLLFNAHSRNNLEDVLRVVIPFGPAWREVAGTYAKAVIEDPTRLRKAQLVFQGAQKFDPDGNGQGFFYRDPTTGEYSFNFPASGWISQLLTGINAPLQAPVKRLSIGLGVYPSIGPVAQIAADQIIPDTPSTDAIVSILMPYGRGKGLGAIWPIPLWAQRMADVYRADTENTATVYGNTYIETMRALASSGEYDLADPNEQQRLYADAKRKAQIIAGMRVLGQFIGPTSPASEFKITTKNGDYYASQLIKELYKLQDSKSIGVDGQPGNYDTAVKRFIDVFGNDAFIYLSSKSESLKGGLEATDVFGDWERGNRTLMRKYPDVAGFLAPGGSDFSFQVWERQMRNKDRRRLNDTEIVAQAQYRIASAYYRELRDKLPATPSKAQQQWLRNWRIELNKQYPGFPAVAEFNPGEYPKKIGQLKMMLEDTATQGNDVADALRTYMAARDKAVAEYVRSGGSESGLQKAEKAEPLRNWLASVAQGLIAETPEFSRIWERLLSNEVMA